MKKTNKRTYNTRRIRLTVSYSVQDVAELFGIHKNAVLRWIKDGLKIIDQRKPYLVYGRVLADFINVRQIERKQVCGKDEFYCCKCRRPRKALPRSVQVEKRNQHRIKISGICAICHSRIFRDGSINKQDEILKIFASITPLEKHIVECQDSSVNSDIP